ncbi:MAG: hypothetical protein NTAFB01_09210 [Nitrospira sp.]
MMFFASVDKQLPKSEKGLQRDGLNKDIKNSRAWCSKRARDVATQPHWHTGTTSSRIAWAGPSAYSTDGYPS